MSAIKAFAKQCGYTHAEQVPGGMFKLYTVDQCEVCGCDVQGANAINAKATKAGIIGAGLIVAPAPEEGGWSDTHGCATCATCN